MKRILSMIAGIILLCAVSAAGEAAERPWLETVNQDVYVNTTLLTEESYPQVCVSPYPAYYLFESDRKEPLYILFPCPEGMQCSGFDETLCSFLDLENRRQFSYQGLFNYGYDAFLDRCEDRSNILLDGTEKAAAYIDPDQGIACGLMDADENYPEVKLYVYIALKDYLQMDPAERKETLMTLITKEIDRIRENIRCEVNGSYWTDGKYGGLKMVSYSVPGLKLTVDLPEFTFHFDEEIFTGSFFPVAVSREKATCYATKNRADTLIVEIEMDTYSYVFFGREEEQITRKTLSDGREWGVFAPGEAGDPLVVGYGSTVLSEKDRYGNEQPVYLNIRMIVEKGDMRWENLDSFVQDLDAFAGNIQTERAE